MDKEVEGGSGKCGVVNAVITYCRKLETLRELTFEKT